jgi:hypothetical protein
MAPSDGQKVEQLRVFLEGVWKAAGVERDVSTAEAVRYAIRVAHAVDISKTSPGNIPNYAGTL